MEIFKDIYFSNLSVISHLGGFFSINKDTSWELKNHTAFSQNKFYYITKGHCIIKIEDKEYYGGPGSWFFIPSNTNHSYHNITGEPFQKYWIHFDIYPTSTNIFNLLELPFCVDASKNKRIKEIFFRFSKANMSSDVISKIILKSCLMELLAEYISLAQPKKVELVSKNDVNINKILTYINDNLDKTITNEELAEIVHMHPNHMIRFFKSKTNQTPARYVAIKKMEYAKRLLETSNLNIMEITGKIGMDDISYFSKLFKKIYADSPTKYRKNYLMSKQLSIKLAEKGDKR